MRDFEPHRRRLKALAYRLLGSWTDAEDVVQEAHLAFAQHEDALEHDGAWLERVVTNRCLDVLKSARVQRETYVGPWLPEPVATEALAVSPVDVEGISLAFLVLLERLSPLERAVFVLAEAFEQSHDDIARVLGRDVAAVRQLLHRARAHVQAGKPRFAKDEVAHEAMVTRFLSAVMEGDLPGLERLLSRDVTLTTDSGGKVRAALKVIHGPNHVARFFLGIAQKQPLDTRLELRSVNGWPAVLVFEGDRLASVTQLETDGDVIATVHTTSNPDKLEALAAHVTAGARASS
jgi:RNA polymerase sigma-70 factor (ECF subfamily)